VTCPEGFWDLLKASFLSELEGTLVQLLTKFPLPFLRGWGGSFLEDVAVFLAVVDRFLEGSGNLEVGSGGDLLFEGPEFDGVDKGDVPLKVGSSRFTHLPSVDEVLALSTLDVCLFIIVVIVQSEHPVTGTTHFVL
jgi:hypothetical protein